jgi:hypothetical protein
MRIRTMTFGFGLALLLATTAPALGGLDPASAHAGHRSCGDFGSEGIAELAHLYGGSVGVFGDSTAARASSAPGAFSDFVEYNHTVGWPDFGGVEFGPCEPAP